MVLFSGPAPYRGYRDNPDEYLPPPPPTSSYLDSFPPPPPETKENIYHEIQDDDFPPPPPTGAPEPMHVRSGESSLLFSAFYIWKCEKNFALGACVRRLTADFKVKS